MENILNPYPSNSPARLEIIVRKYNSNLPAVTQYPATVLVFDNWDDYGYKTSFNIELHLSSVEVIDLGVVKILRYEYPEEPYTTNLPERATHLDPDFCSLGYNQNYYEKLNDLDHSVRDLFLSSMNDVAFDETIKQRFENQPGFQESLLRNPSAEAALEHAPFLLSSNTTINQSVQSTYFTPDNALLTLRFNSSTLLPGRINAIIGYNGVGKTTVLASIAQVSATPVDDPKASEIARAYGKFGKASQRFSTTLAVSYSAFDSFQMPQSKDGNDNYFYFGLRRDESNSNTHQLKSKDERFRELSMAISFISTSKRRESLDDALRPILSEPSFRRSNTDISFHEEGWEEQFESFSSGHQIALAIIVQLVAYMEINSLALIDEPESHLHPPLVAALMKGIGIALERTSSFAVLATHSPVVIQEIPASCVHVLRRTGNIRKFDKPNRETYGENLGVLTAEVFNLDNTESSFEGVLVKMAETMTAEQIESSFELGLSGQARALLMQEGIEF